MPMSEVCESLIDDFVAGSLTLEDLEQGLASVFDAKPNCHMHNAHIDDGRKICGLSRRQCLRLHVCITSSLALAISIFCYVFVDVQFLAIWWHLLLHTYNIIVVNLM